MKLYQPIISIALIASVVLSGCGSGGSTNVAPPVAGSALLNPPSGSLSGVGTASPGGSGASGSAPLSFAQLRATVVWPQRATRSVALSALANSLTLTVTGGRRDGSDYVWKIKRNPDSSAYSAVYTSPVAVHTGVVPIHIRVYAGSDGDGQVLGNADLNVTVAADGSGIPNVAIASPVKIVTIDTPLRVSVGEAAAPNVVAHDAEGNVVPAAADYITLTKSPQLGDDPDAFDIAAAAVVGKNINSTTGKGIANLTATIDGVTSAPTPCEVYFAGTVSFTAPVPTEVGRGRVATFRASVSDPTEQGIIWSVVRADDGNDPGTITMEGVYTSPQRTTTVTIRATSVYDNTKFAETTVTVKPEGINAIIN